MDDDLTAIVAADEEARAGVQTARAAADARVDETRREIDRLRAERLEALRARAEREAQAIDAQTARAVEERVAARAASIAARRAVAEASLDAAAQTYAHIVIEGTPPREPS
jgi:hypothetical protein